MAFKYLTFLHGFVCTFSVHGFCNNWLQASLQNNWCLQYIIPSLQILMGVIHWSIKRKIEAAV